MKYLYLIRHAKSSWDNPELDDFDRPLNSRGEKDAPRMGKRLREKKITPDSVITSPANRALKTCKLICKIVGFDEKKIIEIPSLYHASEEKLLNIVRSIKDRTGDEEENALVFGHNPGLTEFANRLTSEGILNIPTTGVVAIQLGVEKWKDTNWGSGELVFFDFPKRKED
jgi:phosphohistidine phosphatase